MKHKKLMIVIEENGQQNGKGFNVYLDGDKERVGTIPKEDLSPAEFWGSKLFEIVLNVMRQTGAVHTEVDMGANNEIKN